MSKPSPEKTMAALDEAFQKMAAGHPHVVKQALAGNINDLKLLCASSFADGVRYGVDIACADHVEHALELFKPLEESI